MSIIFLYITDALGNVYKWNHITAAPLDSKKHSYQLDFWQADNYAVILDGKTLVSGAVSRDF